MRVVLLGVGLALAGCAPAPSVDLSSIEKRLAAIEAHVADLESRHKELVADVLREMDRQAAAPVVAMTSAPADTYRPAADLSQVSDQLADLDGRLRAVEIKTR